MKNQLEQFTKDFFEGLGFEWKAKEWVIIEERKDRWYRGGSVGEILAQQIALEVMIRAYEDVINNSIRFKTKHTDNLVDAIKKLEQELADLEKLRETLK